jgi:hypothetical protein
LPAGIAKPADRRAHDVELIIDLAAAKRLSCTITGTSSIPTAWATATARFLIRNQHQPGQPHRHLTTGFSMLMRVEPAGGRPLAGVKFTLRRRLAR